MNKPGGYRNFGWGKQMQWAGKQALRSLYGYGHYKTVHSHVERWRSVCEVLRSFGIKDARDIDSDALNRLGGHLAGSVERGEHSVAYAQNLVSTANTVLRAMRGDRAVWASPARLVGNRSGVRTEAPNGLATKDVNSAVAALHASGARREAAVAAICRSLGLRRQEAALLNVRVAEQQARKYGAVNITDGTKGGRGKQVDRWVPVNEVGQRALSVAVDAAGEAKNLVPGGMKVHIFLNRTTKRWTQHTASMGRATSLRDLRAAYACERYEALTNHPAPCVAGIRLADRDSDRKARTVLAQELGHNRTDVIAAYIGSSS